jgi:streptomycin 6-kinase
MIALPDSLAVDALVDRAGLDRERLLAWGLCQSVLSAWWHVEEGTSGWKQAIKQADHFYQALA